MKKPIIVASVVAAVLTMGLGTASAYNYSNWARAVWPYPASVYAQNGNHINEFGPDGFFASWFDFNGYGLQAAPGGNTWIRGRVRCYASSSGSGSYTTVYGAWGSPSNVPYPYSSGGCNTSYPYPFQFQSRVASDGYSTFYYAN